MSTTDELEAENPVKELETCRDFKKGDCGRGNRCKYFHPKLEFCRDYQTKGCNRMNCKFTHVTRDEKQLYENTGQLPGRNTNGSNQNEVMKTLVNGIGCGILGKRKLDPLDVMSEILLAATPQALAPPTKNLQHDICRDFERGDCSRGNRCKYYHPKLRICRDFQNEKCEREACRFLHMSREEEHSYESSGKTPDHIDDEKVKKNKIIDMSSAGVTDVTSMLAKRSKIDQFNISGLSVPKSILEENEIMKKKISELQQQIMDLHRMNDTLYIQNATYRNQIRSGGSVGI